MREYSNKITLYENSRGCPGLDPLKGCCHCINNPKGCYGICYAARAARNRGYDFSKVVKRDFAGDKHFKTIANRLTKLDFVRLGVNCDPSSDWEHTLKIIDKIKPYQKNIVVITKHWTELKECQLERLNGVCVNTSISALDTEAQIKHRLYWYNRLKPFCNSVLRVCTADFNDAKLKSKQNELLNNEKVIDNILRFPLSHQLVKNGTINVKKYKFLNKEVYASKHEESIYFSYCDECPEKCGINL